MSKDVPPSEKRALLDSAPPMSFGPFFAFIAFVSLVPTWLGSLGRLHWFLDLMSHFRPQYFIVCAISLAFALFRRSPWLILASFVSLLWNGQLIHSVHCTAPEAVEKPAAKPLRVLIFNVLGQNPNQEAAINHVVEADADIVCLLEVSEAWRTSLEPLRVKYPHRVEEQAHGNFSIACYTRLPLKSSEIRILSAFGLPTIILNMDHLGRPLTFVGTHPVPPIGAEDAAAWQDQLSQIGTLVAGVEGDVIVGGDLNATPWCAGMRVLREKSGLAFRSAPPVWHPTWGRNLPVMIPIDHVLIKGELVVQKRIIGPDRGSDHRSVLVELVR